MNEETFWVVIGPKGHVATGRYYALPKLYGLASSAKAVATSRNNRRTDGTYRAVKVKLVEVNE